MKKLFFFRSSQPGGANNSVSPPLPEKQTTESIPKGGSSPCLRRSVSYSSANFHDSGLGQKSFSCKSGSPCSSSHGSQKRSDHRPSRTLTPEKPRKAKYFEAVAAENEDRVENPTSSASSGTQRDSSETSSHCSSNVSNKVLDRYIDGEQQQDRNTKFSQRLHIENGYRGVERPPRVQYTAPGSPTDSLKEKLMSCSFREAKGANRCFSSRDMVENGFRHESPRTLAKQVVERLSHSRVLPRTSSKDVETDIPITIEDIYSGSDDITYHPKEVSGFTKKNCFRGDNHGFFKSVEAEEGNNDVELFKKSKEAEERAMILSEELEQEYFLQDISFNVPSLIQKIRALTEERVSMAFEVSAALHNRIAERASAKEELGVVKVELDSRTRRLEKEKTELQLALEKELDRRSSDWSFKLEKYQAEEHRLRERVRELAEQNVSLQREISSVCERDAETRSRITHSDLQLKELSKTIDEAREENLSLAQDLSELREKYIAAEEDRDCFRKNHEEKEKECKEMHKSITRLLKTCSEQEKTINGLREGLNEEVRKKSYADNADRQFGKWQMELMRLTGVEQALRKDVESYRLEVDSLRHENINLLHRLKHSGREGEFLTFKLDQELHNRVSCLKSQGLALLDDSTRLCSKLMEYTKVNVGQALETKQGTEVGKTGLDSQFVIEADMKVQGFKRGTETLRRSLETVAAVLHEKSKLAALESFSPCLKDKPVPLNDQSFEDAAKLELKAEKLVTSLLREKLYSKEVDTEQLQAELAAAVRGNDVLRCEVQNAMDTISCLTHKMKDLELQVMKKEENINQIQDELQDSRKEVNIIRGILPKISEERDMMWEEVKKYSEKNMFLNSEINVLKRKVDTLDEDLLLKEGQITILKDTLGRPFDLLASPDSTREFRLD